MRIVQLNKLYSPFIGGIEQVVQRIAEGTKNTEMRVLVCNTNNKTVEDTVNGVSVRRSGSICMMSNMPISFKYIIDVRKNLKKADVVISHMPSPFGDLALLLSGFKGTVILWWHSDIVKQKKLMKLYKPLMHATLNRADAIVTATEGHVINSDYLPRYSYKCHIIPYCLNPEVYNDSGKYLSDREEKHVQEEKKYVFLFVGRLVYYKGCDVLIRAFADMVEKHHIKPENVELRIVGDGPLKDSLENLTAECNLNEYVVFTGGVDDAQLKREYRNSDALVLPSVAKSEAFGLVQIEAMAYAKPVINTNLKSGVPYVGIPGDTGYTVEPGDYISLSNAMIRLYNDRVESSMMGEKGRKLVMEKYSESHMISELNTLISKLR